MNVILLCDINDRKKGEIIDCNEEYARLLIGNNFAKLKDNSLFFNFIDLAFEKEAMRWTMQRKKESFVE